MDVASASEGNANTIEEDYFQTVPQGLSSAEEDSADKKRVKLSSYIEGPKGKEVQKCARRCVALYF